MEVDFPWDLADVNISRKLRRQDEQRGFVGGDPGNPELSLIEKLA